MDTTLATASASTAATLVVANKFLPQFVADEKMDAGIKAALGLAALFVSVKVENKHGKGALIGVGVGLLAHAAGTAFPAVAA